MSDTPRTDAALRWCPQCPVLNEKNGYVCDAEFARQLERELAHAIAARNHLADAINNSIQILKNKS